MVRARDAETWPETLNFLRREGRACHYTTIADAIGKPPDKVAGILAHHADPKRNEVVLVERVGAGTYQATDSRHDARSAKPTLTSNGQRVPKSDIDYIMKLPDSKLLLSIQGEMWVAVRIGA